MTWQKAASLHRIFIRGKGNLVAALGTAGSGDQVVPEGWLGHDCHLDAVLPLHGRSSGYLLFSWSSVACHGGSLHL